MKVTPLLAAGLAAVLGLAGCKLVKTSEVESKTAATGESGDKVRIEVLLAESYDSKLLPDLREKAVELKTLKAAMADGLDAAGKAHGVRAGGQGGSWNFSIKGTGNVIEENRKSKAGIARIDIDGDGEPDANLQLGPVVKGTALRDVAPGVYEFSSFRDQIEFAKLGRALNKKAVEALPSPNGGLSGKVVSFIGAAALRSPKDLPLIVPVLVEISQ
jgi:predicted lipoprotein